MGEEKARTGEREKGRKGEKRKRTETLGLAHRRLQVERLDVLPVLLEKRDQEVDSQHGVRKDIFTGHLDCYIFFKVSFS